MTLSHQDPFHQLFDKIDNISVQGYNEHREVIYWNDASEKLYGYQANEAFGKKLEDLIIPLALKEFVVNAHTNWLEQGIEIPSAEMKLCRADGKFVDVFSSHVMFVNKEQQHQMYCIDVNLSELKSSQAQVQQKELLLETVFKAIPDIFFIMDYQGMILDYYVSNNQNLYLPPDQFLGKSMFDILPKSVSDKFLFNVEKVKQQSGFVSFEYQLSMESGLQMFEARLSLLPSNQQIVAIVRDITESKNNALELLETEQRLQDLFNHIPAIVYVKDVKGRYLSVNRSFEKLFNINNQDICGKTDFDFFSKELATKFRKNDAEAIGQIKATEKEEELCINGHCCFYHTLKYPLINAKGNVYAVCGISTDISNQKKYQEKIYHQANYDVLTQLPNRLFALERLKQLLNEAKRSQDKIAILFLDLDDFKKINDSLGHEIGDKLLVESAKRLKNILREEDTVGRLGGDEFIILLRGINNASDVQPIVEHLLDSFRNPFFINNRELIITVSVGIALCPDDGDSLSQLMRNADTAMYQAKGNGRNTFSYFTPEMNQDILRRLLIEENIHGALERNEFTVYYQPQINVNTGRVIGAEALLRWKNPVLGDVSPVEFIPIVEQTGLIVSIGQFVISQALIVLSSWQKETGNRMCMAVNLSPRQFRDPELINFITLALDKNNIEANCLELEITEGVLMIGHSYINEALSKLNKLGVLLSMDDFGTGYSSLSYLRQYNFDVLKVDRSFINGIAEHSADRDLVNAAIAMAHSLGLKVVAEGVETEEQLYILNELNCDYVQGYYFSKPVPEQALFNYLLLRDSD